MLGLLKRWPLVRQLTEGGDGTGPEAMSAATLVLAPRHRGTQVARSVCPYCAVGCGQLVHHRDGTLVSIEGDPESPISAGHLCPKGAASHELLTHPGRAHEGALPRAAFARVAGHRARRGDGHGRGARVGLARAHVRGGGATGSRSCSARAIAHLGGATLDNEENYLIKKLFTGGLGMVAVSNQARI